MVELQSCATLVNASALCAIEQEVKGDSVNIVAEISAELERERQKNAELLERISVLEAQIRERDMEIQGNHQQVVARSTKRQKAEIGDDEQENRNVVKSEMASQHKPDSEGIAPKEMNPTKRLVNWMSMDDSQISYAEKLKDSESVADFNETDSDDACEDNYDDDMVNGQRHEDIEDTTETVSEQKEGCLVDHIDEEPNMTCMKSFSGHRYDPAETSNARQKDHEIQRTSCLLIAPLSEKSEVKAEQGKEMKENVRVSQNRKPQKVAFCPKEVKRIIESKALLEKNAQSHTIRKIIVFASLGIRHGCEDMYELDFNHFSILKKGEPYVSPMNPGEHVLYDNPGVRRKIFYPNRENPVLCPVQILEEERAMRPSDASCPSYLFLCIKYGGRTRNLPQNEYVRQRMGRNKLKSFGPLMCRMATLVHIRSGSFFFKALGITLLFMAGFPGDLVQRETKYRNLDLLQKYYRTDEDAEKEELFLPHPIECDNGTAQEPQNVTKKTLSAKSKGRKHANAVTKSNNDSQKVPSQQLTLISSAPSQFGLSSYSSAHTYSMATFHSMASSQISKDASHIPNPSLATSSTNVSVATHSSYRMLPPQAASTFVPVMYWPPPNAFLHGPFHSPYGYHQHSMTFPSAANYMSFQTRPYYNHPTSCSSLPKLEGSGKNDLASDETESDSNSSSGGNEHK